jgi:hypothetical protein
MRASNSAAIFNGRRFFWVQHCEASRNWLALGLLLAAWNAADRDCLDPPRHPEPSRDPAALQRPELLRAYPWVSVRAARRLQAQEP